MGHTEQTAESRSVVERFFAAGARRDFGALNELLDDNVVLRQPEFIAYGGTYEGRDAFPALAAKINQHLVMAESKIKTIVADGDTVFTVQHAPEVGTGRTCVLAVQMTVRGGHIVESRIFFHEPHGLIKKERMCD